MNGNGTRLERAKKKRNEKEKETVRRYALDGRQACTKRIENC